MSEASAPTTRTGGADSVLTERHAHILVVTINRPESLNAIDQATWDGLGDAWEFADTSPDLRAVVVTGAGERAFCAGADLKAIAKGGFRTTPDPRRDPWGFAGVARHDISVPVVAAVNGRALGGGWEIVLSCDVVVAAEDAEFALPEVRRGLIAGGGGAFRLAQQLPRPLALELLLTGRPVTASQLAAHGLVNRIVPADRVLAEAIALAEEIAANAPLAVRATKRIARGYDADGGPSEAQAWARSEHELRAILATEDCREGPRAFVEKRPPRWTGR